MKKLECDDVAWHLGVFGSIDVSKRTEPNPCLDRIAAAHDRSRPQRLNAVARVVGVRPSLECERLDDDPAESLRVSNSVALENQSGAADRVCELLFDIVRGLAVHKRELLGGELARVA